MKTIAEISPARSWSLLVVTLLYLAIPVALGAILVRDLVAARGVELWIALLLVATVFAARALAEQMFLFLALFHSRGVVWLEGHTLVYLSPTFSKTDVADIVDVRIEHLRRGFGKLPYLVMTLSSGRRRLVSLFVCKTPAQDVLQDVSALSVH